MREKHQIYNFGGKIMPFPNGSLLSNSIEEALTDEIPILIIAYIIFVSISVCIKRYIKGNYIVCGL